MVVLIGIKSLINFVSIMQDKKYFLFIKEGKKKLKSIFFFCLDWCVFLWTSANLKETVSNVASLHHGHVARHQNQIQ